MSFIAAKNKSLVISFTRKSIKASLKYTVPDWSVLLFLDHCYRQTCDLSYINHVNEDTVNIALSSVDLFILVPTPPISVCVYERFTANRDCGVSYKTASIPYPLSYRPLE